MEEGEAKRWFEGIAALGVAVPEPGPVLIVDDEIDNLEVLGALLDEDFDVHLARDGREALALVDRVGEFAVVLSDQRMPRMTGVELLTELARRSPETVRMVLTGYADVDPVLAAVNEGNVYRFFFKPWDHHEMRAAVADATGLHRARRALVRLVELLEARRKDLAETLDRLDRTRDQLIATERMNMLGRFTSGISHNLRGNLGLMAQMTELVSQSPHGPLAVAAAQRALAILRSLLRMAEDVSSFARGDLLQIRRGSTDTGPLFERIVEAFGREPSGRHRVVKIAVDPAVRVLDVDPERITQGLTALLTNAGQFSAADSTIELFARPLPDGGASVGVTHRVRHNTPVPELGDLGFGLEIARVVAEAHGGRLMFTSVSDDLETAQIAMGPPSVRISA